MQKYNYIILVLLLMPIINATYDTDIPNYLDVNVTETLKVLSDIDQTNNTAKIYLNDSTILNFTLTDSKTFSLSIINAQEENYNYNITIFNSTNHSIQNLSGVLMFRIPYYLTFNLYETQNQTFTTQFNYLYLREKKTRTATQIGSAFGGYLTPTVKTDYTETFWGVVNNNQAVIKLYNNGTYYITLMTMKTFNVNGWAYEFYKPQYSSSLSETNIEVSLIVKTETNSTYNILLSDYELNKPNHLLKMVKWVLFFVLLGIGIWGAIVSGQILAIFSVFIVWFIMMLIFIFVGWL